MRRVRGRLQQRFALYVWPNVLSKEWTGLRTGMWYRCWPYRFLLSAELRIHPESVEVDGSWWDMEIVAVDRANEERN